MDKNSLNTMLHDYLQGKLSPAEVKHVEKILKEKPELNKELKEIKDYYSTLNMLDPVKAPDDFLVKVHSKINVKSSIFSKIFTPKWLSAEVAGLALSIGLVILIVNPFNFKDAPTIEYDEVLKPDLSQYSVSGDERAFTKDTEKTLDEEFKIENKKVKQSKKQAKITKVTKPKLERINNYSAGAGIPTEIANVKSIAKASDQIVQEERLKESTTEMEYSSEEQKVLEPIKKEEEIKPAAPSIADESKVMVTTTASSKNEVNQPIPKVKSDRKRKDRKSNKIGSYLEPREEKLREIKKKIEELHETRKEQKEMTEKSSSAPIASNKYYESQADYDMQGQEKSEKLEEDNSLLYDTVEKVESSKDISNDDITYMIRSSLNSYKNTVLVIDKNEKIFIITMQKKDFDTFEKWLKVKFGNSFKIKDKDAIDNKMSFKLILE